MAKKTIPYHEICTTGEIHTLINGLKGSLPGRTITVYQVQDRPGVQVHLRMDLDEETESVLKFGLTHDACGLLGAILLAQFEKAGGLNVTLEETVPDAAEELCSNDLKLFPSILEQSIDVAELLTQKGYMQYERNEVVHIETKKHLIWEDYIIDERQKPLVIAFMRAISIGIGLKCQWDREPSS